MPLRNTGVTRRNDLRRAATGATSAALIVRDRRASFSLTPPTLQRVFRDVVRPRIMLPLFLATFAVYLTFLHPWLMNWGTTAPERQMTLLGDEMFPHPGMQFTK